MKYFLFFAFSFVINLSLKAEANRARCEKLFSDKKSIAHIAHSLALFRTETSALPESKKKNLQSQDFEMKLTEFSALVGDRAQALQLFSKAMDQLKTANGSEVSKSKNAAKEQKEKQKAERNDLDQWRYVKKIDAFHGGDLWDYYVTPDSSALITRDGDGQVKFLNLKNMTSAAVPLEGRRWSIKVTPDGKEMLSITDDQKIRLLNLEDMTETEIPSTHKLLITSNFLTPDGNYYITVSESENVQIFDLRRRQIVPFSIPEDFLARAHILTLSADGSKILFLGQTKNDVYMINLTSPGSTETVTVQTDHSITALATIPGSNEIALGLENGEILFLDPITKKETRVPWKSEKIFTLLPTQDGSKMIIGSLESPPRIMDLKTRQEIFYENPDPQPIRDLVLSADGSKLFAGMSQEALQILDMNKLIMKPLPAPVGQYWSAIFTPDGTKLISADRRGNLFIWFRDVDEARKFGVTP